MLGKAKQTGLKASWVLDSVVWSVSERHGPGLESVHIENRNVSLQTPLEYSPRRKNGYSIIYIIPIASCNFSEIFGIGRGLSFMAAYPSSRPQNGHRSKDLTSTYPSSPILIGSAVG